MSELKDRMIVALDQLMHGLQERADVPEDVRQVAIDAHAITHGLAGMFSSDPSVRKAVVESDEEATWERELPAIEERAARLLEKEENVADPES